MTSISPWETEKPEISFLRRVCFHESGHGIIQYLLGFKLTGIKIDPARRYGACSHEHRPDIGLEIKSWRIFEIERDVLNICGGAAAEWCLTGVKEWDHQSWDYRHAVEALTSICEDEEDISAYIELMLVRAKNLLSKEENWKSVVELANALMWRSDNDGNQDRSEEEDLSPENYCESGRGLREMSGDEVEAAIRYAFNKDEGTYDN